jgi:small subunit ribosomal protein S2
MVVAEITMKDLLEAGVHFGHQTRRWNPKMKRFIFMERNRIYIIDLHKTLKCLGDARSAIDKAVRGGGPVLFVATKKQAKQTVADEAARCGMFHVSERWLGGMLTNFITIKKRIGLLEQLEARQQAGDLDRLPKKEAAKLMEEYVKLQATLGGIRKMKRVPGAVFIVDPHRERIAVTEANKLEIPVVGTGDTNVDPDELDYIIPANDDAIRAIRLLCALVADAALEGAAERANRAIEPEPEPLEESTYDEVAASDELVAALAGGGALSFAPDDDDLLPGGPTPVDDGTEPGEAPSAEPSTAEPAAADAASPAPER